MDLKIETISTRSLQWLLVIGLIVSLIAFNAGLAIILLSLLIYLFKWTRKSKPQRPK